MRRRPPPAHVTTTRETAVQPAPGSMFAPWSTSWNIGAGSVPRRVSVMVRSLISPLAARKCSLPPLTSAVAADAAPGWTSAIVATPATTAPSLRR
jgi:hypothetical protein